MRNSAAADEPEDVTADELAGNAVKGDVDLDVDSWPDESEDGDTPGPDRTRKTSSKPAARKSTAKGSTRKGKG